MATTGLKVINSDKRQSSRVPFRRSVKISTQDVIHGRFTAQNLSLGGLFVEGSIDLPIGRDCSIELHETGRHSSLIYHVCGRIAHKDKKGVGIQFVDMEDASFTYLQTMVLYASENPIEAAEHFVEGFVASTQTATSTC